MEHNLIAKIVKKTKDNPLWPGGYILRKVLSRYLPDETYVKWQFFFAMGKFPDLENPRTFSEKLQWLKLYCRKPEYTAMVDKLAVKRHVASVIGEEHVIPTLGVWDRPEDIDWDRLPDRFVLKTTHGAGNEGVVICRDKRKLDVRETVRVLAKCLRKDMYAEWREWPYKDIPKRILAEELIEPHAGGTDLADYKFFCFDGVVKGLFVATGRQDPNEDVKFDFFDADYNHLPFRQGHDHARTVPPKPANFDLMKSLAARLAAGMPHVRVDLYDLGDRVMFGELTLYHFGGLVRFEPEEWDARIGDMLRLPAREP